MSLFLFALSPSIASAEPYFTFNGGGWGHGIGLSQFGARGYANAEQPYTWILAHYYQGTKLVTRSNVTVRVNLDSQAHSRSSWWIQPAPSTVLVVNQVSDPTVHIDLTYSKTYWITASSGNTSVRHDQTYVVTRLDGSTYTAHRPGALIKTFSGACQAKSGGSITILSASGPFNETGVRWRGYLRFTPTTTTAMKCINFVGLENYLYGVVPREMPSSWPAEALKAQAIAARSYAYQDAKEGRTIYCTTQSQVYGGHSRNGVLKETIATNAATDATKGQLVWYGSETAPVKTFFSSSSGGHTASIQDVWTESSPKPYYTGVPDADSAGNPYYTWTVGPLSSSTLSSKLRAQDASGETGLQYCAPSPYIVTAISLERAVSGYTHHLTMKWSNGASYRIKGSTLRSALDMKSTKFGVKITNPTLQSYDDADSRLTKVGPWQTAVRSDAWYGSYSYTAYYSSQYVAKFSGVGVRWIGNRSPTYGVAQVYVDGRLASTVDQYSARSARKQVLFTKTDLPVGDHTMLIKVMHAKNRLSTGYSSSVDRIDVYGGNLLQAGSQTGVYQENHPRIALLGNWLTSSSSLLSGGQQAWTARVGDQVVIGFFGTSVKWIGTQKPTFGQATVTLDGNPSAASLTTATAVNQAVIWSASGLSPATAHRMVIVANSAMTLDRIDIGNGWLVEPTLPSEKFEEDSTSVGYSGTWLRSSATGASGGYHSTSVVPGAVAKIKFDGTAVSWIATKAWSYGKADVLLDGVKVATVDLYSPSRLAQQTVFSRSGLSRGDHTLTIKVLGQKNAASSNVAVGVDALKVTGLALPPL